VFGEKFQKILQKFFKIISTFIKFSDEKFLGGRGVAKHTPLCIARLPKIAPEGFFLQTNSFCPGLKWERTSLKVNKTY
jgi:hypothetical protein